LISFRPWFYARWYIAVAIFGLSRFTYLVLKATTVDVDLAALIGSILAPALFSLLFICLGALRALYLPYGRSLRPTRLHSSRLMRLWQSAVAGCAGGVTGSTLGALFSILLLFLAFLVSPNLRFNLQSIHRVHHVVDGSIIVCGSVGTGLGALVGWGKFSTRQWGDKILIYLAIHAFILCSVYRFILKRLLPGKKGK
jgi:hypothetical protein